MKNNISFLDVLKSNTELGKTMKQKEHEKEWQESQELFRKLKQLLITTSLKGETEYTVDTIRQKIDNEIEMFAFIQKFKSYIEEELGMKITCHRGHIYEFNWGESNE